MMGQAVTATIWRVHYQFTKPGDPERLHVVTGAVVLLTADPTGGDLLDVTKRFVLGAKPQPAEGFTITHADRLQDGTGLAHVAAPDRGWPAGLDVGAVVLEAGSHQQATIGNLRRALLLKDIAIAELEQQLRVARGEEAQP